MKKGFTLIELLVVVLIIGILAAVALPQYTKAVEKSRTAEAMQALGDIATAEQLYYMAKNKFTGNLNALDITMPGITSDTNTFTTNSYTIATTAPNSATEDDGSSDFVATATRRSGTYEGAYLQITVKPNGEVVKECVANDTKSLAALAPTWCPNGDTTATVTP